MKLVSESYQEFKQGGDPYKKLGVGQFYGCWWSIFNEIKEKLK